ncbi:hypothetical protein F1559_005147 [Cyanidiococcus yangmingshanensis]|uniref:WLM domain-containing protein n=1 Tax=Cyanidiococcus yangmingshanensis TaxID=2690220 RepID=A0A7J7IR41_9RHOD|nr:hypothetical protein F1559_005147 [Cyanidiococcus yangmingshanensis]
MFSALNERPALGDERPTETVSGSLSAAGETQNLSIWVNGRPFNLPFQDSVNPIDDLIERVALTWNYAPESVKLISQGRLLRTNESLLEAGRSGQRLRATGTPAVALERIRSTKPDPLVRPLAFDVPGTRPARPLDTQLRPRPANWDAARYGFGGVRVLERFDDAAQARALLERLIADPGVDYVMRKWRWRVSLLSEMAPDGRVSIDPVCVMGLNQNRGAVIQLRLRTDDLAGFRRYDSIREVLAHELAHNEYTEHDAIFYRFMRQVLAEMNRHDWRRHRGYRLGSQYEDTG